MIFSLDASLPLKYQHEIIVNLMKAYLQKYYHPETPVYDSYSKRLVESTDQIRTTFREFILELMKKQRFSEVVFLLEEYFEKLFTGYQTDRPCYHEDLDDLKSLLMDETVMKQIVDHCPNNYLELHEILVTQIIYNYYLYLPVELDAILNKVPDTVFLKETGDGDTLFDILSFLGGPYFGIVCRVVLRQGRAIQEVRSLLLDKGIHESCFDKYVLKCITDSFLSLTLEQEVIYELAEMLCT